MGVSGFEEWMMLWIQVEGSSTQNCVCGETVLG